MVDLTRRGFLVQTSVTGVGIAGGLGLRQILDGAQPGATLAPPPATTQTQPGLAPGGVSLAGPMVIHIRDLATAEISMMVGTQELVYRDPELVSRVVQTAVQAKHPSEA